MLIEHLRRAGLDLRAKDVPDFHRAFAFDLDTSAWRAAKRVLNQLIAGRAHLDRAGLSVRLHPAGDIHRVAPQIVAEFLLPDHPRDDGTTVDADTPPQPHNGTGLDSAL